MTEKPIVLIVDDDRTMRSLLNLAMDEEGYRVVEAKNGEQCISEYAHFKPDLILLDAVMPDLDGFICCRRIRSLPGGENVPILMITVLDDRESINRAFEVGATDYITKPINWEVLAQRVRHMLAVNRAWLELAAVKEELHQRRAWEELMRNILQQLSQSDCPIDSIQQALTAIGEWLKASRVLLYRVEDGDWIESITAESPTKKFFEADFNLSTEYGEQYRQGKTVVIENVAQANIPSALIERFEQLNIQAVSIVPIKNGERFVGWLSVYFTHASAKWQESSLKRFSDLGLLLTMKLT